MQKLKRYINLIKHYNACKRRIKKGLLSFNYLLIKERNINKGLEL